ncbi:tRNA (adenosine(37)-N6)-threonylcarbamoyltransferase complex dimerization subunit type 1 TsaB [Inhella gelatinilytica]|uniref:tRNA (Adenosine(37)-N6)-threonylcarbamoyltransferase complex dimerization subunit type 1 TsaB n=1 Tax=Inhella gelatinilytica TaxID=2795030 RepID=A0A931NDH1_9BURK|nr:tRNA (adenosine(37)-N6)-threonylcarbamoyltransferase complex dimerization subunit type 1 TsaB [Inhella gelatinilytica]MBH9552230.1 tRNA (adenosine(37)-N6)-threonylcarbamoyltransferase complex dimerization subunit type 1 TsaB [Inhella gelatinilytica]
MNTPAFSAPQATGRAVLALEGATDQLALALVHADGRRWWRDAPGGAQASSTLIPLAMALLQEAGLQGGDLAGLAYGRGPGAFTGLRAVCAVVQGLALGWECPVLELDSLALVAEAARQADAAWQRGWVVMDARMGELYAAPYGWDGSAWRAEAEPALWTPEALAAAWQEHPPAGVCGNGVALVPGAGLDAAPGVSRAQALVGLAVQAWARADWRDAALALPLYVRDKVALTTAERSAAGFKA